jgi:hypothetical protein
MYPFVSRDDETHSFKKSTPFIIRLETLDAPSESRSIIVFGWLELVAVVALFGIL